ncbi:MAG: WG repeat-containing protein, partial [Cytophagaceae bacterium]|nr:WG repeat-containing protein [Cytophagaceae bacterium]
MKIRVLIFLFFYFFSLPVFTQTDPTLKFSEGLSPKKNLSKENPGLYGFVNHKGKVVINPSYDTVYSN